MRRAQVLLALLLGAHLCSAKSYGADRSSAECAAEHSDGSHAAFLTGENEPFFSTGPPDECDTQGCLDGFWGPRCRFREEPKCPEELQRQLTEWLRKWGQEGGSWAQDALFLHPCDLWEHMQGRTTWVIGDSVTEDVGHAMSCFMIEYWDKEHYDVKMSEDETVIAALDYGTAEGVHAGGKRIPFWCFQMGSLSNPGRLCYMKADKVKRTLHLLNLLKEVSNSDDVLLINIGLHYNVMEELEEDMRMLAFALRSPDLPKHKIWVETSPQHYETHTGMFNMSRPIHEQACYPPGMYHGTNLSINADGSVGVAPGAPKPHPGSHKDTSLNKLLAGGDRNLITQPIVDSLGMPTLRTWNVSLTLWQFHQHIKPDPEQDKLHGDCTHVCHPSWPQIAMAGLKHLMDNRGSTFH